jgi:uncharacterized protein
MQINVSQLMQEPIGATREYQLDETLTLENGDNCRVRGDCRLLRTQRSILVKCRLDTEVELTCSRCLGAFRRPLRLKFEEEYLPTVDVATGAPLEADDDATGNFFIDKHHVLDLQEAIRQYALLNRPMKPLCREDCHGLCPRCGRNLNDGPCGCPEPEADPRWAKLKQLTLQEKK